ncbi:MAG: ABC transporter ATP-binding protein [Proteobacteria bacterium]|nr:ABC transporter ATP-binding protein [Pseudomonadota bacterium]
MIGVKNLTRYYGDFRAVHDVSFDVSGGEIVGVLGLNGAGKSTILKVLAGLLSPSSGTVTIDGLDVATASDALKARIGYLPENPPQYGDMTVTEFVTYIGRLKGMSAADVKRRLPEVFEQCALKGREHQVIGTLSHGYRKRVGLAQAVIHDPKLVILDEPISGLDPAQIKDMRQVIRRLGEGRAVMISSHILTEISQTCDRVLVIHNGELKAQGTEEELTHQLGDARIVLTVRGDQEEFEHWLQAHPKVESMVPRPVGGALASAIVDLEGDIRETFVAEIIQAGFGIRLVEVPDDELEEAFLGLTRAPVGGAE